MAKRLFDVLFSFTFLMFLWPFFVVISLTIKITNKGPVFYFADRAGLNGRPFKLIKFRTMSVDSDKGSSITGVMDNRVFFWGDILRKTKIDELPQFINVLFGDMSLVGPRPESLSIVKRFYSSKLFNSTLDVRPGMASPGSLFNYTHGHEFLDDEDPEGSYINKFLPVKLALELVYIKHQSFWYDLEIIFRTVWIILLISSGKKKFPNPRELNIAIKNGFIKE